jgi:hypothetical protein
MGMENELKVFGTKHIEIDSAVCECKSLIYNRIKILWKMYRELK